MKNKKFKVEFWLTKEEINLVINLLENREEEIWKEVLGKGKCKQNDTDIEIREMGKNNLNLLPRD